MNVYDFKVKDLQGNPVSLSEYAGKVLLIVNTASKCGFTPQYAGLESLYQKYKEQGLVILGFPCNQFLEQDPGTNAEISSFCQLHYGVTFPIFSKIDVRGENAEPLFQYLIKEAPFKGLELNKEGGRTVQKVLQEHYPEILDTDDIKWNFTKFLIDRKGNVKGRYESTFTPEELEMILKSYL